MKIEKFYEGGSINIISNDEKENTCKVSVVEENNNYSNYYNFTVTNFETIGTIEILNLDKVKYKNSQIPFPYVKGKNGWQKCEKSTELTVSEVNNILTLTIQPNTKLEISLVPRYVKQNLKEFMTEKTKQYTPADFTANFEGVTKITIGKGSKNVYITARQHPGETLSSFFLEGIIDEILENKDKYSNYKFHIYPFVNEKGVIAGVHRYYTNIDYNRSWNAKQKPEEIYQIIQSMKVEQPNIFIDLHNDEITTFDYIKCSNLQNISSIGNIKVLQTYSNLKRFLRALIKEHKIINLQEKTAREFVGNAFKCPSLLVELSMKENFEDLNKKGKMFLKDLIQEERK